MESCCLMAKRFQYEKWKVLELCIILYLQERY